MDILFNVVAEAPGDGQIASGDHAIGILFRRTVAGQQVAGDLLADELVVGQIAGRSAPMTQLRYRQAWGRGWSEFSPAVSA